MQNKVYWLKIIVITLSVYFSWLIILDTSSYDDTAPFKPIPFTILTIYVWKKINK